MSTQAKGQVGMDETIVEHPDLERALEKRLAAANALRPLRVKYRELDKAAKQLVKDNIAVGTIARVGRFRVERKALEARHVEFDAEASDSVIIRGDSDD